MKRFIAALAAAFACAALASPFLPDTGVGTTHLDVTDTAGNLTLPVGLNGPEGRHQFVISNIGTQTVFFRCDGVTATSSNSRAIGAGKDWIISLANGVTTCSAIASTTGSTLYATVGQGE